MVKRILIGSLLLMSIGIFLCGGLFYFALRNAELGDSMRTTFDSAEFVTLTSWEAHSDWENLLQLQFPDSTRDIKVVSDGFQDPFYHLKFEIDPSDLEAFIEISLCDGLNPQSESTIPNYYGTKDVDWWTPEASTKYQSCKFNQPTTIHYGNIFIDQSNADTIIIYLTAGFT